MKKLLAIAPWLVAWSGEAESAFRPCPHAGNKLATWTATAPGVGKPIFKKLHPVRLRQCIAERLCGVCGEATSDADRWMLNRGEWVRLPPGELRFVLRDFLLHKGCADLALQHCPWLKENAPVAVRAPSEFGVIATPRGASASYLMRASPPAEYRGPAIERLWLTMPAAEALRRFGSLVPPPPGLNRFERRQLKRS